MSDSEQELRRLLTEALREWRVAEERVHHERCGHAGGVEACTPVLVDAEARAKALGIPVDDD
jgi:hypothetical protein